MSKFKLYIKSISCTKVTDTLLEGGQDEVYLQVYHRRYSSVVVVKKIVIGKFRPQETMVLDKVVFEEQLPEIELLGFDFFDSDLLTPDDLLGGFVIGKDNDIRIGLYTEYMHDHSTGLMKFAFSGSGGDYILDCKAEVMQ